MGDVAALTWPMTRIDGGVGTVVVGPRSSGLPVKRCLFGPVDHDRANRFLDDQRHKILEEDKTRWNFDFVSEKPLDAGRYIWEKLDGEGRRPDDESSDGGSNDDAPDDAGDEKNSPQPQRQTRITDFMQKRKFPFAQKKRTNPLSKVRRRSST